MLKIQLKNLQNQNPWWIISGYKPEESTWEHRDLYLKLKENLKNNLILNILGLRRVGKSSIMKQLINNLLGRNVKSTFVFYHSFDDLKQIKTTDFLDQLLSFYLEEILQSKVYNLENKVYVFLDEIQYIDNWQAVLKKYYDLSNKKIKFIISGSQSLLLRDKNKESLAGRIFEFYLPPLSFKELLIIKKEKNIKTQEIDLFEVDKNFLLLGKIDFKYAQKLKSLAREYVLNGQFPECLEMDNEEQKNEYILESVLGKLLEDIVKLQKIEKTEELKTIAYQLLNNISSIFELKNIGSEIGVSYLTLEKYLQFLKNGYLLEILHKDYRSIIKKGRSLKKIYSTSTNFTCSLNGYKENHFDEVPEIFGKIIENLIYNILSKKYSKLNFWRDGEKEVDFIIKNKKNIIPIEVKFKNNIARSDLKNIIFYCKKKKRTTGIIITKNILEKNEIEKIKLYYIPYYLILIS